MSAGFTKGPWRVGEYDQRNDGFEVRSNGRGVAVACYLGGTDPALSNARLIAAAPELYEALVNLRKARPGVEEIEAEEAADAALAKARGEQ